MDYEYKVGQLVERISTGERLRFHKLFDGDVVCLLPSHDDSPEDQWSVFWPADDCRPAVDHENAEELSEFRSILYYIEEGHTVHCAKRMTYGDGECECGKAGNGHDTIAVATLKAELAAKDARIAELEALVADSAEREAKLRKLCGDAAEQVGCCACTCSVCEDAQHCDDAHRMHKLRAAAEGGE